MNPIVTVLIAGAVTATIIVALSASRRRQRTDTVTPVDPEAVESWIVRHAPDRARPALRHLDRRVAGGALLVVSLAALFLASLFVGWVLDTVDEGRGFAQFDERAAEWGAERATETSTRVLEIITDLGGTWFLVALVVGIGLTDWLARRNLAVVGYLLTTVIGVTLLNNGLKLLVDRERPAVGQLVGWSGASFPSGHSAAAAAAWAAVALVVSRHASRRWRVGAMAVAGGVAIAVAASRVLLGVHWVTDVVAGLVVGWTWFTVVSLAFGGRLVRLGEPAERIVHEPDRTTSPEMERL